MSRIVSIAALLLPLLGGCAHYEYNLVSPPEFSRTIDAKAGSTLTRDRLRYAMLAYENYLVIRIYNETGAPVYLLGERSAVVDPQHQSHPLHGRTIVPGSFIKLILPPLPTRIEPTGPAVGIHFGYGYGYGPWHRGFYDPYWDYGYYNGPPAYVITDGSDYSWDWTGDTDVSLTLTFQQAEEKPFTYSFLFHQRTVR